MIHLCMALKMLKKPIASRTFGGTIMISLLFVTTTVFANDKTLTEQEAIQHVLSRPVFAELTEGTVNVVLADGLRAGMWDNPEIQYEREQTFGATGTTQDSVTLTQNFDISGSRSLKAEAAEHHVQAVRHRAQTTKNELKAVVRRLFFELLASQQRVAAVHKSAENIRDALEIVSQREAAGDASAYDRQRLERELANTNLQLTLHQTAAHRAWVKLAAITDMSEVDGPPVLTGALLPMVDSNGEMSNAQIENNPEILALNAEALAQANYVTAANRGWIPALTLGAGWTRMSAESARADGFIAVAGLSLPIFDRKQDEEKKAEAEARIIRSRTEIIQTEYRADAQAYSTQLIHLSKAAVQFREETEKRSDSLVKTAKTGYAGHELGIIELLDAYRGASEDMLTTLDLELAARNAQIELDRLMGGSTP